MEKTLQIDVNDVISYLKDELSDAQLKIAVGNAKLNALEHQLDKAIIRIAELENPGHGDSEENA